MSDLLPNHTMFIQLGLFLASYFVLKFLVFDPYLKLIHAREAKTSGLKEAAEKAKLQAEKYRVDYEDFVKTERKKLNTMVDEERRKIGDETRIVIQASRSKASEKLDGLRKQIDADTNRVRGELAPLVTEFSSKIASKLVGFNVTISGSADKGKKKHEEAFSS